MCAIGGNRRGTRSAPRNRRALTLQYMSSERQEGKRKRKANELILSADKRTLANQRRTMTEHSDLLEIVRRPLSPDVQLEVQASWEEYERVQAILDNEESRHVMATSLFRLC
ncbi:hypothetical protein V1507DRAFT_76635 [Lipomyces tetrasporus]